MIDAIKRRYTGFEYRECMHDMYFISKNSSFTKKPDILVVEGPASISGGALFIPVENIMEDAFACERRRFLMYNRFKIRQNIEL
jgi:hypothetical protein